MPGLRQDAGPQAARRTPVVTGDAVEARHAEDLVSDDPLLAVIRAVPMRCADCDLYSNEALAGSPPCQPHAWETDDEGIARAVRVYWRGQRPTREEVVALLAPLYNIDGGLPLCERMADTVLALFDRAQEAPRG